MEVNLYLWVIPHKILWMLPLRGYHRVILMKCQYFYTVDFIGFKDFQKSTISVFLWEIKRTWVWFPVSPPHFTFTSFSSNEVEVPYFIIQRLIGHKVRERDITSRYLHVTDTVLLKHLNDISREILKVHPETFSKSVYGRWLKELKVCLQ